MSKPPLIELLITRLEHAEENVIDELVRLHPTGSKVSMFIRHGQKTPSTGTVLYHRGGRFGYLGVRLDSRTGQVLDVPVRNILK